MNGRSMVGRLADQTGTRPFPTAVALLMVALAAGDAGEMSSLSLAEGVSPCPQCSAGGIEFGKVARHGAWGEPSRRKTWFRSMKQGERRS